MVGVLLEGVPRYQSEVPQPGPGGILAGCDVVEAHEGPRDAVDVASPRDLHQQQQHRGRSSSRLLPQDDPTYEPRVLVKAPPSRLARGVELFSEDEDSDPRGGGWPDIPRAQSRAPPPHRRPGRQLMLDSEEGEEEEDLPVPRRGGRLEYDDYHHRPPSRAPGHLRDYREDSYEEDPRRSRQVRYHQQQHRSRELELDDRDYDYEGGQEQAPPAAQPQQSTARPRPVSRLAAASSSTNRTIPQVSPLEK